jgi:hypothetical protein
MATNLADRAGETAPDWLRPEPTALHLLCCYLDLLTGRLPDAHLPDGDSVATWEQRLDGLAAIDPVTAAWHATAAAEAIWWIRPRWRGAVIGALLWEAEAWLSRSAYQPQVPAWFGGAAGYARAMVRADHLDEVLGLLDPRRLAIEHLRVRERVPGVVAFSAAQPQDTLWYALAMRARPVPAIHAAACLAAWVFAVPGVLNDRPQAYRDVAARSFRRGTATPVVAQELVDRGRFDPPEVFVPWWERTTVERPSLPWESADGLPLDPATVRSRQVRQASRRLMTALSATPPDVGAILAVFTDPRFAAAEGGMDPEVLIGLFLTWVATIAEAGPGVAVDPLRPRDHSSVDQLYEAMVVAASGGGRLRVTDIVGQAVRLLDDAQLWALTGRLATGAYRASRLSGTVVRPAPSAMAY